MDVKADIKKKLGIDVGDNIKSDIQDWVIKLSNPFLVLEWATGVGKTIPALRLQEGKKALIVISQILHEQNWKDEAKKWGINLDNTTFVCYNSLSKYRDKKWDMVILDEGHRWSDMWTDELLYFKYDKLLILSGTLPLDTKKKMYDLGAPKIITITTEDAVDWGLLPEPEINVVELNLDNINPNQIFEKGKNKQKDTVDCTFLEWQTTYKWQGSKKPNLRIRCTEQQYYNLLSDDLDWAKQQFFKTKNPVFGMRMKILGNQRKIFLASLKTDRVSKLISKLQKENKRIVVFASSIEQANTFDPDAVHSQNKDGQLIIDEFNNYKRDLLVSVKQINESMNLVDPEIGIIVQLDNSKAGSKKKVSVKNQQTLGRLLRFHSPVIHVFVMKNTQDEVYLKKFKESINKEWFN